MMARANTDAVLIQDRCEIVRVNVAVREWNDAGAVILRSVDRDAFDLGKPLDRRAGEFLLVRGHLVHPELLEIGDRGRQPDCSLHVGRPALELMGDLVPGRSIVPHPFDHFAATGIASSSAGLAIRAPLPMGPSILWPERA